MRTDMREFQVIEFFMAMHPPTTTGQMRKITIIKAGPMKGRPRFYDPPEVEAAKSKLECRLAHHAPKEPLLRTLRLSCKWCFPVGEGHFDGELKATDPDCDNLMKLLQDVMQKLKFYKNDAQIAELYVGKYYAAIPGIWIRLEEIE